MNDKDKEAFIEYMGENLPYSYYVSYHCPELKTWQAACEYKQREIDFLKDRNKTNISKATCINQVNDGLHILLKEAEAELLEWKEAARSEAEEVNRLQAENKKLKDALKNCLIMSPLDPFERGDMIREALKEVGEE